MTIFKPLLIIAFALAVTPAVADTPINQSHKLAPDATLTVSNIAGAVIVHTWDRDTVRITGTLGDHVRKLAVTGNAHALKIAVQGPDDSHSGWFHWGSSMGPTTLNLTVPKSVNLKLNTVSARIQANGLTGGTINATSVSGNITVSAHSPDLKINSTSGDVQIKGSANVVDINTISGDIRVERVGHRASVQSTSGDIRVAGGPLQAVAMESVSGDVYFDGTLAPDVSANLHSMSGDIHLTLANTPSATLDASSFSGDIHSPWGKVHKPEYGPGSSLHTQIGNGQGTIKLKSFSGDVDIRGDQ